MAKMVEVIEAKNQAYWERDQFVSLLSKIYPSHLSFHPAEDTAWEAEWFTIICIHTPVGQMTWHIHDSEVHNFKHLQEQPNHWDGHTTAEKYERLSWLGELWQKRDGMNIKKKKELLYEMQGGRCSYPDCKIVDMRLLTVDHKMPKAVARILGWTKDQQDAIENLQLMCRPHHEIKDARDPAARAKMMEKYGK